MLKCTSKNIDFNTGDNMGTTAFMMVCDEGQKDIVQLILTHSDQNIDLNMSRFYDGMTALMLACKNGHTEIVKMFLEYKEQGGDLPLFVVNHNHQDASTLAKIYGNQDIAKLIFDF